MEGDCWLGLGSLMGSGIILGSSWGKWLTPCSSWGLKLVPLIYTFILFFFNFLIYKGNFNLFKKL